MCHNGTIMCLKRHRQIKVLCLCHICMAEEQIEWRAAASIFSPPPHAQGTQDAWWRAKKRQSARRKEDLASANICHREGEMSLMGKEKLPLRHVAYKDASLVSLNSYLSACLQTACKQCFRDTCRGHAKSLPTHTPSALQHKKRAKFPRFPGEILLCNKHGQSTTCAIASQAWLFLKLLFRDDPDQETRNRPSTELGTGPVSLARFRQN